MKKTILPNLPSFDPVRPYLTKNFSNLSGEEFSKLVDNVYNEITQWRKNLFKLPSGKAAKSFIIELTTWLDHFNRNTEFQAVALKVCMVLPSLLLQKPSRESKAKDHIKKLEERLQLWNEGRLGQLLQEGRTIQKRLKTSKGRNAEDSARIFAKLIFQGKINAALKFLSSDYDNGAHEINDEILIELQNKHPEPSKITENTLLFGPVQTVLPSYFDCIDETMVKNATRLTKSAAGPSQLDADQYRHILLSTKYKKESKDLRDQIAILAKKIATTY